MTTELAAMPADAPDTVPEAHPAARVHARVREYPDIAAWGLVLLVLYGLSWRPGCICQSPVEPSPAPPEPVLHPTPHHTLYPCTPWVLENHHPDDEKALQRFFGRASQQIHEHTEDVITAQEHGLSFCAGVMQCVECGHSLIMINPRRVTVAKTPWVVHYYPVVKHGPHFLWVHRQTANRTLPEDLAIMKVQTLSHPDDQKRLDLLLYALYHTET